MEPEDQNTDNNKTPHKRPYTYKSSHKSFSALKDYLSTLGVLVIALAIALCMILFVFQSYEVDGTSMEKTLQNQDRLIVWKAPRTLARITGNAYVPHRGDIIIFTEAGLSQYGQKNVSQLVKRVIGLPGDRVVVDNGKITIFNKANPNGFDPDTTLPYGKNGAIPTTAGNIDIILGKDQIFVCGDNRPDSLDSRIFGPVNVNNIIGKLVMRVYPISKAEPF